jgi:Lon protease-like protein
MAERLAADFPLFPLGLAVLPAEIVPLHIFEERYKTMIGECLERDAEFGIVWLADDGLREIGCGCRVEQVLERMDDGRMNLLAKGTSPFRIVERQSHLPYPAGIVEFLDDLAEPPQEGLLATARDVYSELVMRATDKPPDAKDLATMGAYAMAATVDFGLDAKQGLLDLRSENRRLQLVTRLFRAALKRLDFVDRAQARAKSNGKVRFG